MHRRLEIRLPLTLLINSVKCFYELIALILIFEYVGVEISYIDKFIVRNRKQEYFLSEEEEQILYHSDR